MNFTYSDLYISALNELQNTNWSYTSRLMSDFVISPSIVNCEPLSRPWYSIRINFGRSRQDFDTENVLGYNWKLGRDRRRLLLDETSTHSLLKAYATQTNREAAFAPYNNIIITTFCTITPPFPKTQLPFSRFVHESNYLVMPHVSLRSI